MRVKQSHPVESVSIPALYVQASGCCAIDTLLDTAYLHLIESFRINTGSFKQGKKDHDRRNRFGTHRP